MKKGGATVVGFIIEHEVRDLLKITMSLHENYDVTDRYTSKAA